MGVDQSPKNLGIKLSQPFVDVKTAEDKDLILSSSFPMLKELATGVVNTNGYAHAGALIPIYEHKLGYYPFFLVFDDESKMRVSNEWQVDQNTLYFNDSGIVFPPTAGSGNFRWVVYRLPVFTPFKSSVTDAQTTNVSEYRPDYGLKVVKEGRDINSNDLRDFTIHSKGRSPLVDEVNVKDWAPGSDLTDHTVTPNLPYNPIAFGFTLNRTGTLTTFNMQNGGQAPPVLKRINSRLIIQSTGNITQKSSIIVFKDPFLSTTTLEVRY
jgi:hypothetical protein